MQQKIIEIIIEGIFPEKMIFEHVTQLNEGAVIDPDFEKRAFKELAGIS